VSPLLREQHFGIAERKPYGEGGFVRQSGRTFRFEGGESADDVRQRAHAL
jgi:broad specificity phosphatase PhoE